MPIKQAEAVGDSRKLNFWQIAVSLVSIHYGLGFLIGSGEAIYDKGAIGLLYAFSSALGLLSLVFIAPFYWEHIKPIWALMGEKYGKAIEKMVATLSSTWMLGIVASQILGGGSALAIFGVNKYVAMSIITILIATLSLFDLTRLSKVFLYMLLFSSLLLLVIFLSNGYYWFYTSVAEFAREAGGISFLDFIGIVVTTVLITFIGMDFHQFIVQAKTKRDATTGAILGFTLLAVLSFILLAVVESSIKLGLTQNMQDSKQVIPLILLNFGKKHFYLLGIITFLPIIFVSIGSGSGVTKVLNSSIISLNFLPKKMSQKWLSFGVSAVAFVIALTGRSIIELIVSFYAIYIGGVFVPFLAYIAGLKFKNLQFTASNIKISITTGVVFSLIVFLYTLRPQFEDTGHESAYLLLAGVLGSFVVLCLASIKNVLASKKLPRRFV